MWCLKIKWISSNEKATRKCKQTLIQAASARINAFFQTSLRISWWLMIRLEASVSIVIVRVSGRRLRCPHETELFFLIHFLLFTCCWQIMPDILSRWWCWMGNLSFLDNKQNVLARTQTYKMQTQRPECRWKRPDAAQTNLILINVYLPTCFFCSLFVLHE